MRALRSNSGRSWTHWSNATKKINSDNNLEMEGVCTNILLDLGYVRAQQAYPLGPPLSSRMIISFRNISVQLYSRNICTMLLINVFKSSSGLVEQGGRPG
jgi:hypothetical protein